MEEESYKLGKLPAKFPGNLNDLTYYVAGALPTPPVHVLIPNVPKWDMLGNDKYGDCGPAGFIHGCQTDAADTKQVEQWPTSQEVIDGYLSYTGGQDVGVVLSDFLTYTHKQPKGFCGHTVSAFAPINFTDIKTLHTAIWIFDFIYTGITVTKAMMRAAMTGQPWTLAHINSPVVGGHCVPIVAYDDQWLYVITWGTIQKISYPMWHQVADEAWAVITGEFVKAGGDWHGISLKAIQSDLNKLQ